MKKIAVLLALVILGGMTTYEFNRRYYDQTTPEQSAALLSVGSRMLDAFCDEPVEFLSLFADTVVPAELLTSVGSYLEKLHAEKGSCFGHSREDLHGGLTDVVERLHRDLVSQLYATEFQASDFLLLLNLLTLQRIFLNQP